MSAAAVTSHDGRLIIAKVTRSSDPKLTVDNCSDDQPVVLIHGVIDNEEALRRGASHITGVNHDSLHDVLVALYQANGSRFVDDLRGEFCLAVVDLLRHRLVIATDLIGNFPIYWRADSAGLVFSSDLGALLRTLPGRPRLDLRAVADYLTVGTVLGDKTLAAGVLLLNPGSILTYDLREGSVTDHPYAELATFFQPKATSHSSYLQELEAAFKVAVDRALGTTGQIGLSLSGGLDSRALLSAIDGRAASIRTYTVGVAGCADQVIAGKLASIAHSQHLFFPLDRGYLRDFLPNMARMVSLTDGMYLSHGLTEMLVLQFLEQTGIQVLLRGHGAELAKAHLAWPFHTDRQVYQLGSREEFVDYLSARANYITPGLPLSAFLRPEAAAVAGPGSRASFIELLKATTLSAAEGCSYLYLHELHRRFTIPSLELFRTSVDVRLPYLDRDFLRVLLAAPPEWRDTTRIHHALTAAGIPGLLKVRNSNTGAPADAGPRLEFVLDKCNTLLKRLNVRGYRHYHDFDAWMRSMLLTSVETELLATDGRIQGFVDRTALAALVRETRSGERDHAYLLQVLLILELWQRENDVAVAA